MAAAVRVSRAPVICSHSSARALCDVPRNVPDYLLKKIAAKHGVVMVNFVPGFLTDKRRDYSAMWEKEEERLKKLYPNDEAKIKLEIESWRRAHPSPEVTMLDVANHIDHIRKVAGIDTVGIGGDFEGFSHPPKGLDDVSFYPALLAELYRRGYSDEEIKKIAGQNLLRVFREAEKVAAQMKRETN
jgi:membrane dipeptidase